MKHDRLYLIHICECIERCTADRRGTFFADTKTQDAVLRNLQTLAESTRRLSDSLKQSQSDVDWRAIAAFRNVAVHDYLGIDLNQIWDIVERDLPDFRGKIEAILQELGGSPETRNRVRICRFSPVKCEPQLGHNPLTDAPVQPCQTG